MNRTTPLTVKVIAGTVSAHFSISLRDLTSQRRTGHLLWPRQVVAGLAVRHTNYSLPMIGRVLGGRDHTTILNARRRFDERIANDPAAARDVGLIEQKLPGAELTPAELEELSLLETEVSKRMHELGTLEESIELAMRRFGAVRRSFELVAAARAVARARTAVIIAEHTVGQRAARHELEDRLDALMLLAEGGHV